MWDLTTAFDRAPKELYSTDSSIGQTGVTQVLCVAVCFMLLSPSIYHGLSASFMTFRVSSDLCKALKFKMLRMTVYY